MNLFNHFREIVVAIIDDLKAEGVLPADLETTRVSVEPSRDAIHGEITSNAAMVLSKPAGINPRELAASISNRLKKLEMVTETEIAGPGFINMRLTPAFWHARLAEILTSGTAYGNSRLGAGEAVNVEYVSANPTGPLHVAHARGAVVGDVLANLLTKAGFAVTKEYYINDAGAQVDTLACSTYLRYRESLGEDIAEIPEGLYPGDYLKSVGEALAERDGEKWLSAPKTEWLHEFREFAVTRMMELIKADLARLGVVHEVFTSERALIEAGAVEAVLEHLQKSGLIYTGTLNPPKGKKPDDWEPRPQTLFRATEFGDDTDRPLMKSDGSWTYFSNDIANHLDKYRRGFKRMIDIWGADHGGYVKRMKAATEAVTGGEGELIIKLCQMVHLKKGGEPIRMSKRAGTFITLRDLIEEVGKDVVRFMMLTRKNDSQMEFDLEKALEQSQDNPVFYVQYAHARCRSVLRNASDGFEPVEITPSALAEAKLNRLDDPAELELIRMMAGWPSLVESAAEAHEPHRVAYFLNDIATLYHALWNKGKDNSRLRFIHDDDRDLTLARLAMVQAVATVIASGLDVFGVAPVEELR